jgi:hypothetical protein
LSLAFGAAFGLIVGWMLWGEPRPPTKNTKTTASRRPETKP